MPNGDETFQAVEYPPEFKRGVKKYFQPKEFLRRGFYPAFEEGYKEQPVPSFEDMVSGKADLEIDQPQVGMLASKALKSMRALQKLKTQHRLSSGWVPKGAGLMHRVESKELTEGVGLIPQRLWDRIREIKELKPGPVTGRVKARHTTRGTLQPGVDEADVWFNPEIFDPSDIFHEVAGHEGSQMARELGKDIPNLATFRNWWETTHDEMNRLYKWLRRQPGTNPKTATKVYMQSPDEIFSRAVEERMAAGNEFVESVIHGYRMVHFNTDKTLKALRKGLESAAEVQREAGIAVDVNAIMRDFTNVSRFKRVAERPVWGKFER